MGYPPVVVVDSGGVPRTQVAEGGSAPAYTVVESGARPITLTDNAPPILLYNEDGSPYESGTLNAFSPMKATLVDDSADIIGIAYGDSTGNATDEMIYLWFAWLATQYPAFSFVYYPPDGSGGYGSPTTVQSGAGSHTFTLYNPSVAGTLTNYSMGSKFATTFPVTPDFVLWNHGKNHAGSGLTQVQVEGELLASLAQVQLAFPSAQHMIIDQYPNRDDAFMAVPHAAWRDIIVNAPEISLIDLYTPTYVSGDYTDNQHMNATGNSAKLLPIMQAHWLGTRAGAWSAAAPWMDTAVANALNGDSAERFTDFSQDGTAGSVPGAVDGATQPQGMTLSGGIAFTKEASIVYDGAPRSQKMVAASGTGPRIQRALTTAQVNAVKGKTVMFTVIKYIEAGSATTVGRTQISFNGTGGPGAVTSRNSSTFPRGGWMVECIGPYAVPADATSGNISLYADSAGTPDTTHAAYFQWAAITEGKLPRHPAGVA